MDQAVVITILILLMVTVLFVLASVNSKRISTTKKNEITKKLIELSMSIQSNESAVRRDAIIKLDNLLAKALQYYYKNSNLCGDNLKRAKNLFKKKEYNELWEVHKIRNEIVHNDYEVDIEEAQEMYNTYKFSISRILG